MRSSDTLPLPSHSTHTEVDQQEYHDQHHASIRTSPLLSLESQQSDSDLELYQSCVNYSLESFFHLPSLVIHEERPISREVFFTIEKRTGSLPTHRYTLRSSAKRFFNIFPWILFLIEKKGEMSARTPAILHEPSLRLLRETIEDTYINKIVEALIYFHHHGKPFFQSDLQYLKGLYEQMEWEKNKDKTIFTRIIPVYMSLRQHRLSVADLIRKNEIFLQGTKRIRTAYEYTTGEIASSYENSGDVSEDENHGYAIVPK